MLGNIILVIVGLAALIWGADRFVHGAAATARNLGIAPVLIGLTIVAFATSAPEILVSVIASLKGQPGLAFGNAIGSNIANIGLVLGCVAMIRPIQLRSATLRREMPALLAVTLLTVSLFLDAYLSRIDGLVMLTGLVIVMIWLARLGVRSAPSDPIQQDYEAEIPKNVAMPRAIIWLLIGLVSLLVGAHLLVQSSIEIAVYFGVSDVVIGILLVALGTSLPAPWDQYLHDPLRVGNLYGFIEGTDFSEAQPTIEQYGTLVLSCHFQIDPPKASGFKASKRLIE